MFLHFENCSERRVKSRSRKGRGKGGGEEREIEGVGGRDEGGKASAEILFQGKF